MNGYADWFTALIDACVLGGAPRRNMLLSLAVAGLFRPRRKHSALGWKSPVAIERKVALTSTWGGTKA